MNQEYFKSSFNVMNFLSVIPQGHEKALKQAFYNAVALFILFICGAGGWALFYILEPFVKPLIWAVLIGSVLHPFKHSLATCFELWFQQVNESSTPLFFGCFMVPIKLINDVSEFVGNTLMTYIKLLASIGIGVLSVFLIYTYTPNFCISLISYIWYINYNVLQIIMDNLSTSVFFLLISAYGTILVLYWNEENKQLLSVASYVMWFLISLYTARVFGILQIPLFLFILFALSFGFAFEVFTVLTLSCEKVSCWKAVKNVFEGNSMLSFDSEKSENFTKENKKLVTSETHDETDLNDGVNTSKATLSTQKTDCTEPAKVETDINIRKPNLMRSSSDIMNKIDLYASIERSLKIRSLDSKKNENQMEESSKYIYAVVWACALMMIWKNVWIIHFLPIPIAVYFTKHIGNYFGIWDLLLFQWSYLMESVMPWIKMRELAIFPPPIRGLYKFGARVRIVIMNQIKYSINSFASCLVIFGLILFTFCFSFFIIFQIYAEGIHLVKVGAGVVNFTVVNNPEVLQLLPEGWGDKVESVLNDAYVYGREGISKQVRHLLKDVDQVKASEFEKHILELWDRVYQAWLIGSVESNSNMGPRVNSNAVFSSWENFLGLFHKMPDLFNVTVMTDFAKENVGTLLSLLESVWMLLKGNLSLIFQFLLTTLSLILGGGTVVLNFFISTIVFFTALFYLLGSSGSLYKPVELMSGFSPINGSKLGPAFEAAVNGVFKASFKMTLFYGLWTWLIHNLFEVRIVYLPSVLAAILGAVPFLGTYWAAVPAVLDLWLAQQKGMQAVILFLFQCLPISFVDTAIYREIKGGHPYMTGLAIAGGVFCMGIQGAIFGPVLLCCLLVALNMSSNLMKDSPSDSGLAALRHLRRCPSHLGSGMQTSKSSEKWNSLSLLLLLLIIEWSPIIIIVYSAFRRVLKQY